MKDNAECGFCPSRRALLKIGGAVGATMLMSAVSGICISSASNKGAALTDRPEIAAGKLGSMSCAQALATSYADLVALEEQQAKAMASGFGLGMGKKQTCGAVTMMLMLSGLAGKGALCSSLMESFEKTMGSTQCAYFVDQFGYSRCRDLVRYASGQLNTRVFE